MARLPRPLWRQVLPDLAGLPYHPTMSWLAVDGFGFDRAYFDTRRWVTDQQRPAPYPWQGTPGYFPRAFDQGIGRALWFIHGGQPQPVAAAVDQFAPDRRGDLWSGVGLAATFAGAAPEVALSSLPELAGGHRADLAQGAVFAATARTAAGFVPGHVTTATEALTGMSVADAAALAEQVAVSHPAGEGDPATGADDRAGSPPDGTPAYELWRSRIREQFAGAPSRPLN
jgi:enediyne biosynthesis protein E2